MKKSSLLCPAVLCAFALSAQPSFQTSLQAGISLPLNNNSVNATHAGQAIHFGNHLDYSFGSSSVRFGLGAYIGFINSIGADNQYKQVGQAIAEKYRLSAAQLSFNGASFKSTHMLLGPIASFGSGKCNVNIWAKGGYGLNEPSRYAVIYKEGNIVNNIYVSQAGENKNGLTYNMGAGLRFALSEYVGLQLAATYFNTKTDQVNYNFDREKGTAPLYVAASNQFIQASAGVQFTIGNPVRKNKMANQVYHAGDTGNPATPRMDQRVKTKSNIKNDRVINTGQDEPVVAIMDQKIKTKSNIKNDRLMNPAGNNTGDNPDSDSLFFSPEKITLREKIAADGQGRVQLQSVDNYLTGFVYQTQRGALISQCGSNAMPGDPIPGLDVKLKRMGSAGTDVLSARTNKDGSFSFNNIAPGEYNATAGDAAMDVSVRGNNENMFKTLDINSGSCGNTKENYIIHAGNKIYVEVTSAREAGSGMATGKKHIGNVKYEDINIAMNREAGSGMATGRRMHKPYRVAETDFDINQDKIVSSDGKLYAEVITSREAGSGMASGRRTVVTGDVDGDGLTDNAAVATREAGSGMATGRRQYNPIRIVKEIDRKNYEVVSPRDAASGLPTGRRQHQPILVSIDPEDDSYEVLTSREAGSGMATGRRQYQPLLIRKYVEINEEGDELVEYHIFHRDLAAPNTLSDEGSFQKMAISEQGLPAKGGKKGKMVIMQETGNGLYTARDAASGRATGRRMAPAEEDGPWETNESEVELVNNPLYESSGTSGENPLFEGKSGLRVTGSNGIEHALFLPSAIFIKNGSQPGFDLNAVYEVGPIKWMTPEIIGNRKGIQENGIKKNEANARKGWDGTVKGGSKGINEAGLAGKGISENGIQQDDAAERKGWDGSVKGSGKGINQSGISAKGITQSGIKRNEAAARKGWDGTVKGGAMIKDISRVHCADGSCSVDALVEVAGVIYEAVISGVLKTKHDTAKNSVGNIR